MVHALKGRPQSPEHVRKRVESIRRSKQTWTEDKQRLFCQRVSASNRSGEPEVRRKIGEALRGKTPWNKGNRWQDNYTPEEVRAIQAERARRRRARNPRVRINGRMSAMMRQALKAGKAGRKWETLVDYDLLTLMAHLEAQFQPSMSWDNMGEWHIDHIRPRASFDFESEHDEAFKECWALDNLQPLWAVDNLQKRDRQENMT